MVQAINHRLRRHQDPLVEVELEAPQGLVALITLPSRGGMHFAKKSAGAPLDSASSTMTATAGRVDRRFACRLTSINAGDPAGRLANRVQLATDGNPRFGSRQLAEQIFSCGALKRPPHLRTAICPDSCLHFRPIYPSIAEAPICATGIGITFDSLPVSDLLQSRDQSRHIENTGDAIRLEHDE